MKITQPRDLYTALVSNAPGSGTSYSNTVSGLTATDVQAAIDELVTGITGTYLTVVGGGRGTVQAHGNLGATETIDLAAGNYHWGTLNANCTIGFTGWTNLKDCQITLELIEDGTGGWTPTFTGVTWIGGTTPTHVTTVGTTTLYAFLSRDGGTTIYGAMVAAGGSFVLAHDGGQETITAHGNTGATETFFAAAEGNVHTATLNAATVTFTFAAVTSGKSCSFTMLLTQDGTGGRLVTWPGSVVWQGGAAPVLATAAAAVDVLTFFTLDGGTVWFGFHAGAGSSFATPAIVLGTAAAAGAATTVIRSDSTIVAFDATVPVTQAFGDTAATGSVALAARRDHKHGMPATPAGSNPHAHVVSEAHLSNGSGTTYTLDEAFELGSVIAWNTTALARLGVTEAAPDQATVSAAGSSGDTIMFDYAATVV